MCLNSSVAKISSASDRSCRTSFNFEALTFTSEAVGYLNQNMATTGGATPSDSCLTGVALAKRRLSHSIRR